ncbi:HVO_A0556 family zinc finger protein [Haladaptatus cibarius]|uniref:HVO_A0556 family zinc finger protein n=1 Tax=Haladaptatus cibarius TaxID=453847 RepID=UPI0034A5CAC6
MAVNQRLSEQSVLTVLHGRTCEYCEAGILTHEEYKGNEAAVCDNCETPAMQVW